MIAPVSDGYAIKFEAGAETDTRFPFEHQSIMGLGVA